MPTREMVIDSMSDTVLEAVEVSLSSLSSTSTEDTSMLEEATAGVASVFFTDCTPLDEAAVRLKADSGMKKRIARKADAIIAALKVK